MLTQRDIQSHDVVILADFTLQGDCGLRLRREIQAYHKLGYKTAIRHLGQSGGRGAILPDIRRTHREGLCDLIAPGTNVHTKLAIVFSPSLIREPVDGLTGLHADKVVLVHDRVPNPAQMGYWFNFSFGPITWAPTNRWVRAKLLQLEFPIPLEPEDWRPIGAPLDTHGCGETPNPQIVIGRVSAAGTAQWPKTPEELGKTYPKDRSVDFRVMGRPPSDLVKAHKPTKTWSMLDATDVAVERFLEPLDVFMYYPSAKTPELPEAAIATAMASGKIVILPPHLQPHFGPGALYAEAEDALAELTALFEDPDRLAAFQAAAQYHSQFQFSEAAHLEKISNLIGKPGKRTLRRKRAAPSRKRALFIPSNGVGLGHAARLLSIARRMREDVEPIFASFGQVSEIIEGFGYATEYIPSYTDINASIADWDAWLRVELEDILNRHRPSHVIYDGNNPTPGMVHAALAHGDCALTWVRRGMCPATPSPYLDNARFFDCIIEPGEYARAYDTGPTASRRHEVIEVPPIRLLDQEELLSRAEAARRLGLAADRPAVLIQLGGGAHRDLVDLIDRLLPDLRRFDGLQIVIAEWTTGKTPLPQWPGTKMLRGFPISRYFNAFDFSIAAAGYNTFHEVLAFELPTIFLADRSPTLDTQSARAEFAQDQSAGFDLAEDELHHFPALCEAMLNPKANAYLRQQCAGFDKANGAGQAAKIIERMMV